MGRIRTDQAAEPVQIVLLDRWTLSGIVYSALRFDDIGTIQPLDYYEELIKDEAVPDITVVIEEPAEVIVDRMDQRLANI